MIDAYLRARVRTRVVYNLVAVTIDSSLSLLLPGIADLLTIMINQLVRNERLEFAAFAKGRLDSANCDHGESSSTPINAISTKCSLSLVNEVRRGQNGKRGFVYDEDHCFLIM